MNWQPPPPPPAKVRLLEERAVRQSRRVARENVMLDRLRSVRVPMVRDRRVETPPAHWNYEGSAAADSANGVIYANGAMSARTAAHESAHLLDRVMTDADKGRFSRIMGMSKRPWDAERVGALGDSSKGRGTAGEAFADMVAMLATGQDPRGTRVVSGYLDRMPSRRRLLRLGRSLERFGARNDLPTYVRPRR